jgi:hypothetical protein
MYGCLQFEPLSENPILSALPPLIVIKGEDGQAVEWLNTTMQFMASEMASERPGFSNGHKPLSRNSICASGTCLHCQSRMFKPLLAACLDSSSNWDGAESHPPSS